MRNSLFLLVCLLITVSTFAASTWAVNLVSPNLNPAPASIEYNLPYPGLLPDHPLYPIKALRDKILELLTKDPVKKINIQLLFSDKRLVMGQLLMGKGTGSLATTTLSKGEKYLLSAAQGLVNLKSRQDLPPGLADKLGLAAKKHEEVINKIILSSTDEMVKTNLKDVLLITHQASDQIASIK